MNTNHSQAQSDSVAHLCQTFNPATYVPELDLNSVKDKTWFYNQLIIVDHGDPQQGELNLEEVV